MTLRLALPLLALGLCPLPAAAACTQSGPALQILGSGGPTLQDRRASGSYLVWQDGAARVLVNVGGGSALRFQDSGAGTGDLDAILFTDLGTENTAGVPALIELSWFAPRTRPLRVYGPAGYRTQPSTMAFMRALFDKTHGAYRDLGGLLGPLDPSPYKLRPYDISPKKDGVEPVYERDGMQVLAVAMARKPVPALAWRVVVDGKSMVFAGGIGDAQANLVRLARGADLLLAAPGPEASAAVIGRVARDARVKQLVLVRARGQQQALLADIRQAYAGPVGFAEDLECFLP